MAFVALLAAFATCIWPALVLFIVLYLRKPIRDRLDAVEELDWKNKLVRFRDARADSLVEKHLLVAPTGRSTVSPPRRSMRAGLNGAMPATCAGWVMT
jgi:hypothetical protein